MTRAQTPAESPPAAAPTRTEARGIGKPSPAGCWWRAAPEGSAMHFVACFPSCSVRTGLTLEAWLMRLKVQRTSEVVLVSGCHCFLGDPLSVLLQEWKAACRPFGLHLSLQTQHQDLESKKKVKS